MTTLHEQIKKQLGEIEKENREFEQEQANDNISNLILYKPKADKIKMEFK